MGSFSFKRRAKSFLYAFRGAKHLLSTQHNAWLHAVSTVGVVFAALLLHVSKGDWVLLIIAMALVWMAEAMNTAIEFLADEISEEHREKIGKAKDVAAFAVLISAIASVAIGAIVFIPHIAR